MPVIINDLEVIIEAPESAPATADGAAAAANDPEQAGRSLAPGTLERIERHRRERATRIRGY